MIRNKDNPDGTLGISAEPYWSGPYIPLYPTLVLCGVFFAMFVISNLRWQDRREERDKAAAELHRIVEVEIPIIEARIQALNEEMEARRNKLWEERVRMLTGKGFSKEQKEEATDGID